MKKYLIGLGLFFIVVIGLLWWSGRVTHLDSPVLKLEAKKVFRGEQIDIKTTSGKQMVLTGFAYPNARVAIYIDDQFTQDILVSADGTFHGNVSFSREGTSELKAKQVYKNVSSEFSGALFLQVDLTPPDKSSFKLSSIIPNFSKEQSLTITGKTDPSNRVLMNGTSYPVENDGSFTGSVSLVSGENTINISLSDEVGNSVIAGTYKVVVDNLPPKISTVLCSSKPDPSSSYLPVDVRNLRAGEEYVCISTGQWEDWRDPAPIPIIGYVIGDIKSITIDGKRVYPDENDEIYQRVYLPVPKGLNKYKVVAIDKHGNQTSTSLTMTVQSVRSSGYDDVIDRLDDIEGQINDLP